MKTLLIVLTCVILVGCEVVPTRHGYVFEPAVVAPPTYYVAPPYVVEPAPYYGEHHHHW